MEEYYTQRKRCQLTRWSVDQHSSSVLSLIAEFERDWSNPKHKAAQETRDKTDVSLYQRKYSYTTKETRIWVLSRQRKALVEQEKSKLVA
jgi:hypothetical protein